MTFGASHWSHVSARRARGVALRPHTRSSLRDASLPLVYQKTKDTPRLHPPLKLRPPTLTPPRPGAPCSLSFFHPPTHLASNTSHPHNWPCRTIITQPRSGGTRRPRCSSSRYARWLTDLISLSSSSLVIRLMCEDELRWIMVVVGGCRWRCWPTA
jgi:hypothetical protein